MRVRKYSDNSINTYISLLRRASKFFDLCPSKITYQQIKDYLDVRIREDNISASTINQIISAFKILFVYVLKQQWNQIEISRLRREVKLSVVFLPLRLTNCCTKGFFLPSYKNLFCFDIDAILTNTGEINPIDHILGQ